MRKKGTLGMWIILVALLGMAVIGCTSSTSPAPAAVTQESSSEIVVSTSEGPFDLATQRGKVVVLFFSFVG